MIKNTAIKPWDRERMIKEGLKKMNDFYKDDPYAKAFGMSIAGDMVELTGRILPPPSIEYNQKKIEKINANDPGKWNQRGSKYLEGTSLNNWAVLDLAQLRPNEYGDMLKEFQRTGRSVGIQIQIENENVFYYQCNEFKAGQEFARIIQDFKEYNTKLDMIMVVLSMKGSKVYNEIKQLGDIHHRVPTQCVVKKTLFKQNRETRAFEPNGQVNTIEKNNHSFFKVVLTCPLGSKARVSLFGLNKVFLTTH